MPVNIACLSWQRTSLIFVWLASILSFSCIPLFLWGSTLSVNVVSFCFLQNSQHRIQVRAGRQASPSQPQKFASFVIESEDLSTKKRAGVAVSCVWSFDVVGLPTSLSLSFLRLGCWSQLSIAIITLHDRQPQNLQGHSTIGLSCTRVWGCWHFPLLICPSNSCDWGMAGCRQWSWLGSLT